MKIFLTVISLLILFWGTCITSPIPINDRASLEAQAALEKISTSDFSGLWLNTSSEQKKMITRCKISYDNNRFVVQMWGSCLPQDCDWGEKVAIEVEKGAENFELLWDQVFAESAVTYELSDEKLKMTHKRHYKDNTGRSDFTLVEYFVKH